MAGIAYKEEVLSYETDSEIHLNFSESVEESSELSWSQIIYLKSSVLVCKVFGSTLILEQLFFIYPTSDQDTNKSIEKSKKIRLTLQGLIVPQLAFVMSEENFTIFIATSKSYVYKLTFNQDTGFTDNSNIKESGGYILEQLFPCSFALISMNEDEYEFCMGLENGNLCFASFPASLTGEYICANKIVELKVKTNLIKSLKDYVFRRSLIEKTIRIANVKNFRIVTLSSFGVLRLHNSEKRTFLAELDLETGPIGENKFAFSTMGKESHVVVGIPDASNWWIWVARSTDSSIEIVSKYSESGLLIDLAVDFQGIWSAWTDDKRGKVLCYPFTIEEAGVFSRNDQIAIDIIEDSVCEQSDEQEDIVKRIFVPNRFPKKVLESVLNKEDVKIDSLDELRELNLFRLKRIFIYFKQSNCNWNEIIGLCCNEEPGRFPPIVLRRGGLLGLIRPVSNFIEKKSLAIQKEAIDWNPLNQVSFPESLVMFRHGCKLVGLDKCLVLVRTWRQNFKIDSNENLIVSLKSILTNNIHDSLCSLLRKFIPSRLNYHIGIIFQEFASCSASIQEKNKAMYQRTDTQYSQSLFSIAIYRIIKDMTSYFIDLTLFLLLCQGSLSDSVFDQATPEHFNSCLIVTNYLWALTETLGSKYQEKLKDSNDNFDFCQELYSFPAIISNFYFCNRSYSIYKETDIFSIEHLNDWICRVLTVAVKDVIGSNRNCVFKNYALLDVLSSKGQSESIDFWIRMNGDLNIAGWYYMGKSLIVEGKFFDAQRYFVKAATDLLSGNHEDNYNRLLESPFEINKHKRLVFCNQSFNMLNYFLSKEMDVKLRKSMILFDFILSSFFAEFSQETVEMYLKKLISYLAFDESYEVVKILGNKKLENRLLRLLVDKAVSSGNFSKIIQIPLSPVHKSTIFTYLIKNSRNEHFDLFSILTHKDYHEITKDLFSQSMHDIERGQNVHNFWHKSLYSFASKHYQYSLAAEASYYFCKEIEDFLNISNNLSEPERYFVVSLYEHYLLLTLLAMRNIRQKTEQYSIRVVDYVKKKKDGTTYEVMKMVQIDEIERKYADLEAKYSRI